MSSEIQKLVESVEPKEGWIAQCARINVMLADCHATACQIVEPCVADAGWKDSDIYADKLDTELGMALLSIQDLAAQLKIIAAKF